MGWEWREWELRRAFEHLKIDWYRNGEKMEECQSDDVDASAKSLWIHFFCDEIFYDFLILVNGNVVYSVYFQYMLAFYAPFSSRLPLGLLAKRKRRR